ncbi:MAG TPA: ABC transporter substrate-binding protein [Nitrospirota bacterium]|nr:ABC transporter substrate-binding protein [Nitrospirota bacterium]
MKPQQWLLSAILALVASTASAADKTVGVIMTGNLGFYQEVHKAFAGTLGKEGFDHRKVDTLLQMPSPDPLSWTNAARKMAVAEVNVIVAYGAPAAISALKETKSIPIVYAGVYDPQAIGVAARNVTGISCKVPMTSLLKYLRKMMPFTKLAVVYNENEPDSVRQADELTQLEGQYGYQSVRMPIKKPDDARKLVFAGKADVVFITMSSAVNEALEGIVKSAHASKIPTVSQTGGSSEKGVILSLAPSPVEQGEAAGRIAARLLRGESPASIPPEVPKLVELVLNLKEANALGIKVPMDLITDATRIIK